jgi:hypothetical protein
MSWGLTAITGSSLLGNGISYFGQQQAAKTQADAAQKVADMYQKQFSPYAEQGTRALASADALAGVNGADAQQQAIEGIQNSPMFNALQEQGTKSILQSRAATGGLRTGTTNDILAQYSPQLLNQLIQQQFGEQYSLANTGLGATERSVAGQGDAIQQGAAAQAGGQLAGANTMASTLQTLGQLPMLSQLMQINNRQGGQDVNPAVFNPNLLNPASGQGFLGNNSNALFPNADAFKL